MFDRSSQEHVYNVTDYGSLDSRSRTKSGRRSEVPGAGLSKEVFIEPATSGCLKPDYESGALAPLSGSDQAEPPRQKAAQSLPLKSISPRKIKRKRN